MEVFEACKAVNDLIESGQQMEARNSLINLLSEVHKNNDPYPPILNHLIRESGLYPYMKMDDATWQERYLAEAFKVNVGDSDALLHREQSQVLKLLLDGLDIAVSAPTSFGKSFIIDAFIAIKKPHVVVIIVPTIALMDETRRRIFKKFSGEYSIITTSDIELSEKSILIFPQERAFGYIDKISSIDLLVVDEFYKASAKHDPERSPSLVKAILKLGKMAKQRYFLAPNIKHIRQSVFTNGMEFVEMLDFNTVYLEKHDLYKEILGNETKKSSALLDIIKPRSSKSLIYAGSYPQIDKVANLIVANMGVIEGRPLLSHFAAWLAENYDPNWQLTNLARRGVGIHNGKMHRSLSQLQIRIFEHPRGFDSIISTSSIIEGVNTSAENVIIWRNRLGQRKLTDFTYKNIIGRGGRMFKHFVGNIYLLEAPPADEDTQLDIEFPDQILGGIDEEKHRESLNDLQVEKIIEYKVEMSRLLGDTNYNRLVKGNILQNSNSEFLLDLARDMKRSPQEWRGFGFLNSDDTGHWERMLYNIINLTPAAWDIKYSKLVAFIRVLSKNWARSIPQLLKELDLHEIDVEDFFKLERTVTFKMASLLGDVNELHKAIVDPSVDVSPFISKLSHAFLPGVVCQLEEYGLPRMVARKIHSSGMVPLADPAVTLPGVIQEFQRVGYWALEKIPTLTRFDKFILQYFFEGITPIVRSS